MVGMTITSTMAVTMMAATAIAGHKKHGTDKHVRVTLKAGLLSICLPCETIAPKGQKGRRKLGITLLYKKPAQDALIDPIH
jgi:hypothetical protein